MPSKRSQSAAATVKEIRRKTRRKFSSEEKIRIVLEGLRGERSVSELCRREGIVATLYYRWSVELALQRTDLSPRELAWCFTDEKGYFVSESSVYRILKAHDLITSPAYILMSASDSFKNPTRRVHEM